MKIDIQIKDMRLFAQVALLVENESFQWKINEQRKNVSKIFSINPPITANEFSEFKRQIYRTKKQDTLDKIANEIRHFFLLPLTFQSLIEKVLFCNSIDDEDVSQAYIKTFTEVIDEDTIIETPYILFTPEVSDKDIIRAISTYRDSPYAYMPYYWKTGKKTHAIRNFRDWYWKQQEALENIDSKNQLLVEKVVKESVDKILDDLYSKCPKHGEDINKNNSAKCTCKDRSTIQKGINFYSNSRKSAIR